MSIAEKILYTILTLIFVNFAISLVCVCLFQNLMWFYVSVVFLGLFAAAIVFIALFWEELNNG
jgi:hypothetical protein